MENLGSTPKDGLSETTLNYPHMEYEESEYSGILDDMDDSIEEGVHIRAKGGDPVTIAVFDEQTQVSREVAALQRTDLVWYAEGYSEGKHNYK